MKIEKIPEGYLLAKKGGNSCELWRTFNGAESFACEAIDELIAERDTLRAKITEMEKQEPVAWAATDETKTVVEALGMNQSRRFDSPLFLAAGAQPAPSLASNNVSLISEGKTQPAQSVKDAIIDDLQSQFDTEGITEHDSGDALIRLSDAIAAVEDNFAQPAPSIPDDVMRDAKRYRFLRAAKNVPISTEAARDPIVYDAAIDAAMLAATPKPEGE